MATRDRWAEMSAKYETVDKEDCQRHLAAFIKSFVVREKREQWTQILLNKLTKAKRDGRHIFGDLDRNVCGASGRSVPAKSKKKGVYYEFSNKALWLPVEDALSIGQQNDAIFSIEEGKLAVFFFHEFDLGGEWICAKLELERINRTT